MKIHIFIVAILTFTIGYSQARSGKVVYKSIFKKENTEASQSTQNNPFRKKIFDAGAKLIFELNFNDKLSEFKLTESLSIDESDFAMRMAIFIMRGNSVFYSDRNTDLLIENREYLGEQLILEKPLESFKWKLSNEKKNIQGYECYKATGIKYGSDKQQNVTETPITLWYAPQISFNYGPFESCGLPGLVLEYDMGKYMWTAKSINLDNKTREIKINTAGTSITEEEINKELKKKIKS